MSTKFLNKMLYWIYGIACYTFNLRTFCNVGASKHIIYVYSTSYWPEYENSPSCILEKGGVFSSHWSTNMEDIGMH